MLLLAFGFVTDSEQLQRAGAGFGWFLALPVAGLVLASILRSGRTARTEKR
jgi:hypothetical protein